MKGQLKSLFLFRLRPKKEESVYGYLIRLSDSNGFGRSKRLMLHLNRYRPYSPKEFLAALHINEVEIAHLGGAAPKCFPINIERHGMDPSRFKGPTMRCCPLCLKEESFHRSFWSLNYVCACPKHGVQLIDHCPRCGNEQRLNRCKVHECECGFDLRRVPVVEVEAELIRLHQDLFSAYVSGGSAGPYGLSIEQHLKLLDELAHYGSTDIPIQTGYLPEVYKIEKALVFCRGLIKLLSNWPQAFHTALEQMQKASDPSSSLQKTFGRLYRSIYKTMADPEFSFLRDAFEEYISEHWWGLVSKNARWVSADNLSSQRLTIKEVARKVGVAPSVINQMQLSGMVDVTSYITSGGRYYASISDSALPHLEALGRNLVSLQTASEIIGLQEGRVRELLTSGVIEFIGERNPDRVMPWLIHIESLNKLLAQCESAASRLLPEAKTMTLETVLRHGRLKKGEFPELIKATCNGTIRFLWDSAAPKGLLSLVFETNSLKAWRLVNSARGSSGETVVGYDHH